jgi:hypothetical protein
MSQQELPAGSMPEITDDNLIEAAPRVRALVMSRLEHMWRQVEIHMVDAEAGDRALDPRMLEIGKGLMKEVAAIYRLGHASPAPEEEVDEVQAAYDRRAIVAAKLDELEAKRRARDGQDRVAEAS